LVLDEADRLLDMGFERQVRQICEKLATRNAPAEVLIEGGKVPRLAFQTLLVSATLTPAVRRLASFCLRKGAFWADPEEEGLVEADPEALPEAKWDAAAFAVPKTLVQWYCEVPLKERLPALLASIVSRASKPANQTGGVAAKKAIVFFSSCASVDFHHDLFLDAEWPTRAGISKKNADDDETQTQGYKGGFVGLAGDKEGQEEAEEEDDDEDDEEEEREDEDEEDSEEEEGDGDPEDAGEADRKSSGKLG